MTKNEDQNLIDEVNKSEFAFQSLSNIIRSFKNYHPDLIDSTIPDNASHDEFHDSTLQSITPSLNLPISLKSGSNDKAQTQASQLEAIRVEFSRVNDLAPGMIYQLVSILDSCLGTTYSKINGESWKIDKSVEMKEDGLIYGLIKDKAGDIIGFISFKVAIDDDKDVLYLYEIQIMENYRNLKLGSRLLKFLNYIPIFLNQSKEYLELFQGQKIYGNSLTVFSSNLSALKLYSTMGYTFADHSPTDRKFRFRVQKPTYYILIRPATEQ